jgi:hypothetical protein
MNPAEDSALPIDPHCALKHFALAEKIAQARLSPKHQKQIPSRRIGDTFQGQKAG